MPTYCKSSDIQALVSYKFKDSANNVVKINNAPIEVVTYQKQLDVTENFSKEGFGIRFYSPNNRIWIELAIHDYQIYPVPDYDFGSNYEGIAIWECGKTDFQRDANGNLSGTGIDITTLTIIPDLKCPVPLDYEPKKVCTIEIKYNNSIVFSDRGECPINYSVVCGEECPTGTTKCFSTNYPGYCCLPCKEMAGEIKAIANLVRRLNRG